MHTTVYIFFQTNKQTKTLHACVALYLNCSLSSTHSKWNKKIKPTPIPIIKLTPNSHLNPYPTISYSQWIRLACHMHRVQSLILKWALAHQIHYRWAIYRNWWKLAQIHQSPLIRKTWNAILSWIIWVMDWCRRRIR